MGALVVMASIMALHAKCHDRTVQLRQVAQRMRAIAESRKGCGVMAAAFAACCATVHRNKAVCSAAPSMPMSANDDSANSENRTSILFRVT